MRVLIVLQVVVVAALATVNADSVCYKSTFDACRNTDKIATLPVCNAKYGGIDSALPSLQTLVNTHITRSLEYLLLSTHYSNYQKSREGFEKMFRSLSDTKWNDAIDLIKYITKRGGSMNFNEHKKDKVDEKRAGNVYELDELESLAKAIDIEKDLATDVNHIHAHVSRRDSPDKVFHDPEISSHLEEHFAHTLSSNIRSLSGHFSDLSKLVSAAGSDSSLSVFLFDEYLQKL